MKFYWQDNFEILYKEGGQRKHGIRLLAMWQLQKGASMTAVCSMLGKTQKTIRQWRNLYERGGLQALLSIRAGRGRKGRLPDRITFAHDIEELQAQRSGGRIRCQDIVEMICKKYQISYSQSGMYHVLHRFGFAWISARSKYPKHNPELIENFKKTLVI